MEDPRMILAREMVKKLGLQAVSAAISRHKSAVSHVLNGDYKANPELILRAIEEKFSRQTVECPVLGLIALNQCVEERSRPFSGVNPIRVRLAKTCPVCRENGGT